MFDAGHKPLHKALYAEGVTRNGVRDGSVHRYGGLVQQCERVRVPSSQRGKDVFVHYTSVKQEGYKSLKEGDEVDFDIIQGTQGLQADNVTPAKKIPIAS